MPDQILRDVTHLASTLADQATKQLDTVLKEFRGDVGEGRKPNEPPQRVNVGTMAFSVLQLASKVGSLLTELSEYDLVRKNTPVLTLKSSNPLTSIELEQKKEHPYELLIENDGVEELKIAIEAQLIATGKQPKGIDIQPKLARIFASERRHIAVTIPALTEGKYCLSFTVTVKDQQGKSKVVGKKVVDLIVLPAPKPHDP